MNTTTTPTPLLVYEILGFICAAVGLLFFPVVLGPLAVLSGIISFAKGRWQVGTALLLSGVASLFVGMTLGFILAFYKSGI